jgi:hypothetical protein
MRIGVPARPTNATTRALSVRAAISFAPISAAPGPRAASTVSSVAVAGRTNHA